jgi:hypothetical protein
LIGVDRASDRIRAATDNKRVVVEKPQTTERPWYGNRAANISQVVTARKPGATVSAWAFNVANARTPIADAARNRRKDDLCRFVLLIAKVRNEEIMCKPRAFISLRDNLDLSTPSGRLMFEIIGAMAEFERPLIHERVRSACATLAPKGKRLERSH